MVEKELIEECKNGDLQNFRKIFEKTSPMVYSVAFRILCDDDTARDIVQETMIAIWQKLPGIKSSESFTKWVYRITVNKCYDVLRKKKNSSELTLSDDAWSLISGCLKDDEDDKLENSEISSIIRTLTDKLSPRQKIVFVLSELEDRDNDEIAGITGMSRTSIKTNLYHARRKMRMLLKKLTGNE